MHFSGAQKARPLSAAVRFRQRVNQKREAYEFLKSVENRLNQELPAPNEIQQKVDEIRASAARQPSQKHLRDAENAFTNTFVVPILSGILSTYPGMTRALARKAFLSESYQNLPDFCSETPARRLRHTFQQRSLRSSTRDLSKVVWRNEGLTVNPSLS